MDNQSRLEVFEAQTKNVRELDKVRKQITRTINDALRKDKSALAKAQTKILLLVYAAWSEALFSKIIHTPYGFDLAEIRQIKKAQKQNGISEGWKKCIELGLRRIANSPKSNYIPNIQKKLLQISSVYVFAPSKIRNKIAHGQLQVALNRKNTAINHELTNKIKNLDVVTLTRWFKVQWKLSQIIEALIESPNRTFHRDYWVLTEQLENYLEETKNHNLEEKVQLLKRKSVASKRKLHLTPR